MNKPLITIGFNKHGEADFGINCDIKDLSFKKLEQLRGMIPVAIYVAENMWRGENEPVCYTEKPPKAK